MTTFLDMPSTNARLSFAELCTTANINNDTLLEFVRHDIAIPIAGAQPQQWLFHVTCVAKVKKAARLYRDLDIEWADLYLVLNLLDEIDQLKNENDELKQQLARLR